MLGEAYEREILRQASIALHERIITLWEISSSIEAVPLVSSVATAPSGATKLDLDATLRQWGAPIIQGSRWVGCRLDADPRWCVAPVRARPAAPPPRGVERRSRERLILELAGLGLGAIGAADSIARRLSPTEALWEHARQPSVIAHEVGNPLTAALGNLTLSADALRDETSVNPDFRARLLEDLDHVAQGIERAADYLRSIQEPPSGMGRRARFDVTPVVRSCVTLEGLLARKRGVSLKLESSVEFAYLFGDSGALYQVLTNLIRNAVAASEQSSATVTVVATRDADTLQISVRDRGTGIPPELRDKIFQTGFTTKPSGQGSGIGLAVVKEITQNMFGGSIELRSEQGRGSAFTLTLPIPPQRKPA